MNNISNELSSNQTSINDDNEFSFTFDILSVYSFYLIIGILASVIGLIGNFMVMISILASKELRNNSSCILCLNIAFSDFLMSFIVNGFGKIGKLSVFFF
jgi:hypothetical protein